MILNAKQKIYCSAEIEISSELGLLKCGSESIRLGPVNMQVLVALLENEGQVLSRNDIFDRVWKNQVISDDTLTRCISDLRSQLKILSSTQKFIETIPKRGYRWVPEISMQTQPSQFERKDKDVSIVKGNKPIISNKRFQLGIWLVSLSLSLVLLTILVVNGVNLISKGQQIRVALFPHDTSSKEQAMAVSQIEDILKRKLLTTANIRFLSSSIIDKDQQNVYPRLSREFAIKWIIEVQVRNNDAKLDLTLNLVDARTGIVHESISSNITLKQQNIESLIDQFILSLITNSD